MKFYYETRCKRCDEINPQTFTESDINPAFDDEDESLESHFDMFIMIEKHHPILIPCPNCGMRNTFQEIVSVTKTEF